MDVVVLTCGKMRIPDIKILGRSAFGSRTHVDALHSKVVGLKK